MKFSTKHSLVSKTEILYEGKKLQSVLKQLNRSSKAMYSDDYASINLPVDATFLNQAKSLAKQYKDLDYFILIGIGGSNLGALAVLEALNGKFSNYLKKPKFFFVDNVDSDYIAAIKRLVESDLKQGKKALVNVITKSGTTVESISGFEIFLGLLKKYSKDWQKYIIITTDKGSKLWDYGIENSLPLLEVPAKVGGRYSVLSNVGLFPLCIAGIDISQLLKGAADIRSKCLNYSLAKNIAAQSALSVYLSIRKNKLINLYDHFFFSSDLEQLGKWCRQLVAESLGKKHEFGLTPIVSIGVIDLHSMAQLYLGGPNDRYTSFISVKQFSSQVKLPDIARFEKIVRNIQGRQLSDIMSAIYCGVKNSYAAMKMPFSEIVLEAKTEYEIGKFLQFKMFEVIFLAELFRVNPFDQPAVEKYKEESRKILAAKK